MNWVQTLQRAIRYIEENLYEDIRMESVADEAYASSANFQRVFHMITGITVGDYIRCRRLSLAGRELKESDCKVLDGALKYGYETAESFTKAFLRFHGISPSAVKKHVGGMKYFAPFSIQFEVRGGLDMHRKIISGVPFLTYDGNNAAYFVNIISAALQGLNETWDLAQITAYSGEGNRFCWTDGPWVFGNELTDSCNETPFAMETRLLHMLGWKSRCFTIQRDPNGNMIHTDVDRLRRDFVEAIDKGVPVMVRLAEGHNDYNLFFGYEDEGWKMIGWDYQHNNSELYSWVHWEHNLSGYIVLAEKTPPPNERDAALMLFGQIVAHARQTTEIRGRKVGFAAWESFLYHLETDDFSACALCAANAPTVNHIANSVEHRFIVYCDALCQIYARMNPLPYYRSLAQKYPEWREDLERAICALEACAAYGGFLWGQGFTFDEAGYAKFQRLEAHKPLAEAGRQALHKDREAVERLEAILRRESLPAEQSRQGTTCG